jgi:hypothetical protein
MPMIFLGCARVTGPEHARSNLSSVDSVEAPPIEEEARDALRYFESSCSLLGLPESRQL